MPVRRLREGEDLVGVLTVSACSADNGYYVGEEARRVALDGLHIGQLGQMAIVDLNAFLEALPTRAALSPFGRNLVMEALRRTEHLIGVGLGYLALYRTLPSLSGGEAQRLFLSSHLDAAMDALIYILGEPAVGLHELEKAALLDQLAALVAAGNTVIVVEHDPATLSHCDWLIELGPGAGSEGGEVIAQGRPWALGSDPRSRTGPFLQVSV